MKNPSSIKTLAQSCDNCGLPLDRSGEPEEPYNIRVQIDIESKVGAASLVYCSLNCAVEHLDAEEPGSEDKAVGCAHDNSD